MRLPILALCLFSICSPAAMAAKPGMERVPLVACKSDGQTGLKDAPNADDRNIGNERPNCRRRSRIN